MSQLQGLPLDGLTILDLSQIRAGPACVRQFADWGANVIKIEAPAKLGRSGSPATNNRDTPDFQNLHRNKRSIVLDLKSNGGRQALIKLAEKADIVVENFRPSVTKRLGIDYESLRAVNPRLIYASISGFGADGPYSDRPGVDQIIQGMSGLMSITGEPGRGPMKAGFSVADVSGGLFAALGIFVALYERERSGLGQHVQTSLLQSMVFMMDFLAAQYAMSGKVATQHGNQHPTGVPSDVYKTIDGAVNIAPLPQMWPDFCRAMGLDHLIDHPDYDTPAKRRDRREEVNRIVEDLTLKMTSADIVEKLNASGIPCGPIYTIEEAFNDPQAVHMKLTQSVVSETLGEINLLAQPIDLSRSTKEFFSAAPTLGQHTDEVLQEFGFSANEISSLRDQGVLG